MSRLASHALAAVLFCAACGFSAKEGRYEPGGPVCADDSQCAEGEICFADGCGDPFSNIVVEVLPNTKTGLFSQDLRVDTLSVPFEIKVRGATAIQGAVKQRVAADAGTVVEEPFQGSVSVRALGESTLIPGRVRRFEGRFTTGPDGGTYDLPVASGTYTLTGTPGSTALPPMVFPGATLAPGQVVWQSFVFPAESEVVRIDGRLVKTENAGGAPLPITTAEMEIQAFDPTGSRPLSQKTSVSSGQPGSTGDFRLVVSPEANKWASIQIVASPKSSDAPVPRKSFELVVGAPSSSSLQLGDFGDLVSVNGRIVSSSQQPVAEATVYLEGIVEGGGSFRSGSTKTDAQGVFSLMTLPAAPGSPMTLVAVPPDFSLSGAHRARVPVPASGGTLPDTVCTDRARVAGTLRTSDKAAAAGVRVTAVPLDETGSGTITSPQTTSNDQGDFELFLDPGKYRLDFVPSTRLPLMSRMLEVLPGSEDVGLPAFTFSKGRSVTGTVVSSGPVPFARVTFFRVVQVSGEIWVFLLGETVSDSDGTYEVTLPTR